VFWPTEEDSLSRGAEAVEKVEKNGSGTFEIVPLCSTLSRVILTRVPGGNGSGVGSDLLRRRPQVRPPSNQIDLGKDETGRRLSSSL
jgi:hypothetical protein